MLNGKKIEHKYDPSNLFLETYNYDPYFENEILTDTTRKSDKEESVDLSDIPPPKRWSRRIKRRKMIKNINSKQTMN